MLEAPERRVPMTYDRAATELIRCRRHLQTARESLEVALEIFERLNGNLEGSPAASLEGVLGGLEEAEATLRSAGT